MFSFPAVLIFTTFPEEDITRRVSVQASELETFRGGVSRKTNKYPGGRGRSGARGGEGGRESLPKVTHPGQGDKGRRFEEATPFDAGVAGVASREIILMDFLDSLIAISTSSECW